MLHPSAARRVHSAHHRRGAEHGRAARLVGRRSLCRRLPGRRTDARRRRTVMCCVRGRNVAIKSGASDYCTCSMFAVVHKMMISLIVACP